MNERTNERRIGSHSTDFTNRFVLCSILRWKAIWAQCAARILFNVEIIVTLKIHKWRFRKYLLKDMHKWRSLKHHNLYSCYWIMHNNWQIITGILPLGYIYIYMCENAHHIGSSGLSNQTPIPKPLPLHWKCLMKTISIRLLHYKSKRVK